MKNRVELRRRPERLILDFFELVLVGQFEDTVACEVISLSADIFSDALECFSVRDAHCLEQGDQVVWTVCAVGTSMAATLSVESEISKLRLAYQALTVVLCLEVPPSSTSDSCTDCIPFLAYLSPRLLRHRRV